MVVGQDRRVHAFPYQQVCQSQNHQVTICRDPKFSEVMAAFLAKDFAIYSFEGGPSSKGFSSRALTADDPTTPENSYSHINYCFNLIIFTSGDQKLRIMVSPC